MGKTIKIIDLANKVANGEAPTNIKYKEKEYYLFDSKSYLTTDKSRFFDTINFKELNEEVEIIEEDKEIEHIKLKYWRDEEYTPEQRINVCMTVIDELVKAVNELKKGK